VGWRKNRAQFILLSKYWRWASPFLIERDSLWSEDWAFTIYCDCAAQSCLGSVSYWTDTSTWPTSAKAITPVKHQTEVKEMDRNKSEVGVSRLHLRCRLLSAICLFYDAPEKRKFGWVGRLHSILGQLWISSGHVRMITFDFWDNPNASRVPVPPAPDRECWSLGFSLRTKRPRIPRWER